MKYLIIILLAFNSITLLSQTNDSTTIDDSVKISKLSWTLSVGTSTRTFGYKLIRLTYLYKLSNQISMPFEFSYYASKFDKFPLESISIRFYGDLFNFTNLYFQMGIDVPLPIMLTFQMNLGFGIDYKNLNIEIRHFMNFSGAESIATPFLSIGFNF